MTMQRRDRLDRYYTPQWVTEALLEHVDVSGIVLEPCAGMGGIADVLERHGRTVLRCDIDRDASDLNVVADFLDPGRRGPLLHLGPEPWIITNPPYSLPCGGKASDFVHQALDITPRVAMLLRLSWLEPCNDRVKIFRADPPVRLIILPRISFRGPGGRGKGRTDSVTSAWMVWGVAPGITWVTRQDVKRIKAQLESDQ